MKPLKEIVLEDLSKFLEDVPITMIKDVPQGIRGDFSFPCFAHAKRLEKNPNELAEELSGKLKGDLIKRVEAKDGFVNIFIDSNKLAQEIVGEVNKAGKNYGSGGKKDKLIVEHTSANPNAPLHVGHLRNSIIGDSTVRILRFVGHDVEAQFFVNDMGGQLALLASKLDGTDYKKELADSKKKPDVWLGEMYVSANKEVDPEVAKALQKNYERGGTEIRKIFDFMVETALSGFKETFTSYNITLDSFVRESDFVFGKAVHDVLEKLKTSPYWFEKDGVSALNLKKYGIEKELVLLRSDGTTLYTTRDLAYHMWKLRAAKCINVIANEQTLQQTQLRAGLDILGIKDVEDRVRHLSYELVTVPGMRMSSRSGEFISADELLAEGIKRAKKEMDERALDTPAEEKEKIARAVAVGAVRFNMVKITPLKPIEFRWEEAINFEGESAPYLQYSHARACRILEKTKEKSFDFSGLELTTEESELFLKLARFPEVIESAARDLKPNLVANYLMDLAEAFNKFYFKCPVLDSGEPLRSARVATVHAFRQVMQNGLMTLGIEPLEKM